MRVKTPMGLGQFEVRSFSGDKFSKVDLALTIVIKNKPKVGYTRSIMFSTIAHKDFFFPKVVWERHSIDFFFSNQKYFTLWFRHREARKFKSASIQLKTFLYDIF